jgi:heme exporter protein A
MFKIKNLEVSFENQTIFENINIDLNAGNLLIVNGENGSGKTTFLKSIAGLIQTNSSSQVLCVDHDINEYFDDYIYDYSYLSSENLLNEDFSVKYYLNFWAKSTENYEIIDSTIHYFQLANILNYKISQLSSGWQKRISLAKIMIENRMLWFFDEPFNFLDIKGIDLLENMINSRLISNGIVIITSNKKIENFKNAKFLNIDQYKNKSI